MQNWALMRFFEICFLIIALTHCKHARIEQPAPGPYEGLWVLGSPRGCLPVPGFQGVYQTHGLRIKGALPTLRYIRAQQYYSDAACRQLFLLVESQGSLTSIGPTQVSATSTAEQITVIEAQFAAVLTDPLGVDQANLQGGGGLQQAQNFRLCGLERDWKIYEPQDVSNKPCGLGIYTAVQTKVFNLMQAQGNQLKFGVPTKSNYPMMVIDTPQDTWYRK